jgi:hypothetical protein
MDESAVQSLPFSRQTLEEAPEEAPEEEKAPDCWSEAFDG